MCSIFLLFRADENLKTAFFGLTKRWRCFLSLRIGYCFGESDLQDSLPIAAGVRRNTGKPSSGRTVSTRLVIEDVKKQSNELIQIVCSALLYICGINRENGNLVAHARDDSRIPPLGG